MIGITTNADGTFTAIAQHCTLDLLIIMTTHPKNMDQEIEMDNMFTQEIVWGL